MQKSSLRLFENHFGKPIANLSYAVTHRQVRAIERGGIKMMHTARPFSYYRRVFYQGQCATRVIEQLKGKTIVDVGCGFTPFSSDSMFQACHKAGIDFYGVDPQLDSVTGFELKDRLLARAMGSRGRFNVNAPGLSKALSARAESLPFDDESVDEILCSYLLFVWIEDEAILAEILGEFLRVLKPGATIKLYPLHEWRFMDFKNKDLIKLLSTVTIEQRFVHGGLDFRVTPAMLTQITKSDTDDL